ncbi:hypothetical protein [Actinotalea sp. Marseille-Q4924]|uniref:hypothetical protein n=1 Tax=Actinotalea sp. Marseille-Q4924 TaxID=2866571 RepID=UPI001CE45C27|nr:hypothetical protein [Actinotalea sp. Marseille-Q4924]
MRADDDVHNEPNGLLAALVTASVLAQPEVALTRGIAWVLGLEGASGALDQLVRGAGLEPSHGTRWFTEVAGADGGRTDLECHWGTPSRAHVVVEAKLGDALTYAQFGGYRSRLPADGGLLVALLPQARRAHGDRVVAEYRHVHCDDPVRLAVWTYDDVLGALEAQLPDSGDLAQLRSLLEAHEALDVPPLTEDDLWDDGRIRDLRTDPVWRVLDAASSGIFGHRLPAGRAPGMQMRRYVAVTPDGGVFAVGVGLTEKDSTAPRPWPWLVVPHDTPYGRVMAQAVAAMSAGRAEERHDATLVPLEMPLGVPGAVMVPEVRARIEGYAEAARDAVVRAQQAWSEDAPDRLLQYLPAVAGIAPIAPADMVDSSDRRLADIEHLVDQLGRSATAGRVSQRISNDPDYRVVRYMGVPPLATYVSTAIGARTSDDEPLPWAWLRVPRGARTWRWLGRCSSRWRPAGYVRTRTDARSRSTGLLAQKVRTYCVPLLPSCRTCGTGSGLPSSRPSGDAAPPAWRNRPLSDPR